MKKLIVALCLISTPVFAGQLQVKLKATSVSTFNGVAWSYRVESPEYVDGTTTILANIPRSQFDLVYRESTDSLYLSSPESFDGCVSRSNIIGLDTRCTIEFGKPTIKFYADGNQVSVLDGKIGAGALFELTAFRAEKKSNVTMPNQMDSPYQPQNQQRRPIRDASDFDKGPTR